MYSRADSSSRIIDFDRNHSLAKLNRHIYIYTKINSVQHVGV